MTSHFEIKRLVLCVYRIELSLLLFIRGSKLESLSFRLPVVVPLVVVVAAESAAVVIP